MKKKKAIKIVVILAVIIIFALAIVYLVPVMKNISTKEGKIAFKEKLDNLGIVGALILFLLQIVQIFFVVIPGEPLEVLAGMCYGNIGGTIFITISVFITTTIIFLLVRKYGKKLIYESFKKEKIDKIEKSKVLKNQKKIELIMIILFLIPGTPKDLLVYIGGLLPIKPLRFILISTFARFPSVISSTIVGASIVDGNVKVGVISYVITFFITAVLLLIVNVFDKDKDTKEALEILK